MIQKWSAYCSTCESTDVFYRDDAGDTVLRDDLIPLIKVLETTPNPLSGSQHNAAVLELRTLLYGG